MAGEKPRVAEYIRARQAAPIFVSTDVDAALARYEKMGFSTSAFREGSGPSVYGFICFGPGEFHIARVEGIDPKKNPSAAYLYVENADAVYENWSKLALEGTLHPPVDTEYGLREMAYVDPDGNCIRIGSELVG